MVEPAEYIFIQMFQRVFEDSGDTFIRPSGSSNMAECFCFLLEKRRFALWMWGWYVRDTNCFLASEQRYRTLSGQRCTIWTFLLYSQMIIITSMNSVTWCCGGQRLWGQSSVFITVTHTAVTLYTDLLTKIRLGWKHGVTVQTLLFLHWCYFLNNYVCESSIPTFKYHILVLKKAFKLKTKCTFLLPFFSETEY